MKKSIALVLSLVMAFSAFSAVIASAADADIYYWGAEECTLEGKLSSEPVSVALTDEDTYHCFEIDAAEAGIYKVTISFDGVGEFWICSISNGIADDNTMEDEKVTASEGLEGKAEVYFEMNENEQEFLFTDITGEGNADITVSYVGSVTEITLAEPVAKESQVEIWDDEETTYSSFSYTLSILFENGDTADVDCWYEEAVDLTDADSVTVSGTILGKDYTVDVMFTSVNDIIESIDLPDGFEAGTYNPYSGEATEQYPEYIVINYTDGTSEKYGLDDGVLIPAAGEGEFIINYGYEGENLVIEVAGFRAEFEGKETKDSFIKVIPQFFSSLSAKYQYGFSMLGEAVRAGDKDGILSSLNYIVYALRLEITNLKDYLK